MSTNYWKNRALQREGLYYKETSEIIKQVDNLYIKTFEELNSRMDNIYKNSEKVEEKDPYIFRINQVLALKKEATQSFKKLGLTEEILTKQLYEDLIKESYNYTLYHIKQGVDIAFDFSQLNDRKINQMLTQGWKNSNFSKRIWKNNSLLLSTVEEIITAGAYANESYASMSKKLQERMGVGKYVADRLIRTESNYFANQGELKAYQEAGIKKYRFLATLDKRTSKFCRDMDGKICEIDEIEVGENYPPLHPFCRSTTIAIIDEENIEYLNRKARNPITNKNYEVPADTKYSDWEKEFNINIENSKLDLGNGKGIYELGIGAYISKEHSRIRDKLNKNLNLNLEDERAIYRYIGSEAYILNESLRTEIPLNENQKSWVEALDIALDKLPNYKGKITRSLEFYNKDNLSEFLQDYSEGKIISYKQYISTTKGGVYNPDGQIQINIYSISGKDISSINKEEEEILFKRNSKFIIFDVEYNKEDNKYFIELREISDE